MRWRLIGGNSIGLHSRPQRFSEMVGGWRSQRLLADAALIRLYSFFRENRDVVASRKVMPMRRLISPAVLLGVCIAPLLFAAGPEKNPSPPPPIEAWIAQLGDKDFQRREGASKALAALG